MKLTSKDFSALRMPAIALAAAVAVSTLMVWFTSDQRAQAERQSRAPQTSLRDARIRLQRSGDERETVIHFVEAYRQLEKIGFVGKEQRLNWVESLRTADTSVGLFGVEYRILAQEPYPYIAKDNPIAERIRQSRMNLSFGVLHEDDLARLFRALAAQRSGMFSLNSCVPDRSGRVGSQMSRQARQTTEFELSLLTIEPVVGTC